LKIICELIISHYYLVLLFFGNCLGIWKKCIWVENLPLNCFLIYKTEQFDRLQFFRFSAFHFCKVLTCDIFLWISIISLILLVWTVIVWISLKPDKIFALDSFLDILKVQKLVFANLEILDYFEKNKFRKLRQEEFLHTFIYGYFQQKQFLLSTY
jgi:hypothetical protein